jgi:hypothetical protein
MAVAAFKSMPFIKYFKDHKLCGISTHVEAAFIDFRLSSLGLDGIIDLTKKCSLAR